MKKTSLIAILCVAVISFAGCSGNQNQEPATQEQESATQEQESTTEEQVVESDSTSEGEGNTLIAYFTWADNTEVENPEDVDIDATTSASVLPPGNVARMADWIQEEIGGDLFSIQVEDLYSSDYDECLDRASEENAENARPELATHVENMDQYDTIYLGYPNWWYSCPMAILSFIDEYDLEGKQIVLFCSHGTGGLAGSVQDITQELPDGCEVSDNVLGVYRPEVADSRDEVVSWAQQIEAEIH